MKNTLYLTVAALSLSACASLIPPSAEEAAALPTVRFGQTAPAGKDYVLLYPAGVPLPMDVSITGNLFEKNEQTTLNPRLKRDFYLYKTWGSYDGKTWQRANHLVGGKIELHLPGEDDGHKPGTLSVEFHEK
jgi:hypothetical protein